MYSFIYFLQSNPCQHPIVILRDITEDDLGCILRFMYHGEVQVAEEHLKDFLKTAETLQVKGLAEGSATPVLADETGLGGNEVSKVKFHKKPNSSVQPISVLEKHYWYCSNELFVI